MFGTKNIFNLVSWNERYSDKKAVAKHVSWDSLLTSWCATDRPAFVL